MADALAGAMQHLFPGRYQFESADVIAEGLPFPLNLSSRMYGPAVDRFPHLWGALWHLSNGRRWSRLLLGIVSRLSLSNLRSVLLRSKPDLVVSTHPWGNHVPARLLQELAWKAPLVTVVTDLVSIHRWWLCAEADLCLVPTDQIRSEALEAGIAPEKVHAIGIPVALEFSKASPHTGDLRRELGLKERLFTVLLVGGAEGTGNVFDIARAVAQASLDLQLTVVAGKNDKLRTSLQSISWEIPTRVFGFVRNMPDLMHAADLLITKAGPSTIWEALACERPLLISGSYTGQEEGNAEWAVESGAALFTPTPQTVVAALRELLQPDNEALALMADSARRAARPHAALEAASMIHDLLGKAP